MPELLLELLSEEIPARMQSAAAQQLERLMSDALKTAGLAAKSARGYATPRRLALVVTDLPLATEHVREEKKGPRVGAPDTALQGFLRSTGLAKGDLKTKSDGKGEFYIAVIEKPGRPTVEVIADIVPAIIAGFHWPKSMRWASGTLRWVRPLQNVLCVFDGKPAAFAVATGDGELIANDETVGHRFLSTGKIRVRNFDDYRDKLASAHVVLDAEERKAIITRDLARLAAAEGLEPIEDVGLLDEVAGLVEDPVVLIGKIDESFLDVPPEVLSTAMRAHQKYFSLRDKKTGGPALREGGGFAPRFGVVANLRAKDGGKAIVAGNERVLRARLSDARFFWDQDRKDTLESRVAALEGITFHAKLGSMADRVERIEYLAGDVARSVSADQTIARHAARLSKADLTSGMVGEFPELQGVMGRYYALKDGEPAVVADAIRDHYRPQGPTDSVPTAPISMAVAIADKLEVLTSLFAVDERPTGSRDPFALRRAALGLIRIALTNQIKLRVGAHAYGVLNLLAEQIHRREWDKVAGQPPAVMMVEVVAQDSAQGSTADQKARDIRDRAHEIASDVGAFVIERLKVHLRDIGARFDLVDAVLSRADVPQGKMRFEDATVAQNLGTDDPLLIVKRVEALSAFLATEDGKSLLVAHDRAANILRIEEKKDDKQYTEEPDERLIAAKGEPAERELLDAIFVMQKEADAAIAKADFESAMRALAKLRGPVDKFFDKVTVNAKEPELRVNRLRLLSLIRRAMTKVADFSKIEGAS